MNTQEHPWVDFPVLVLDVETSGLDPLADRVVELAAVLFRPHQEEPTIRWSTVVCPEPGFAVPEEAAKIHGVTSGALVGAPSFGVAWTRVLQIAAEEGAIGCAYNAAFDRAFLRAEHARAGLGPDVVPLGLRWPWLDPLVWVREVDRFAKGTGRHKLATTLERWKLDTSEDLHVAEADAVGAGRLMRCARMRQAVFQQATGGRGPYYPPALSAVLRWQAELSQRQDRRHRDFTARAPEASQCKSCGAAVRWVVTKGGKRMPLDVAPVEGGNVWVNPEGVASVVSEIDGGDGRPDPLGPFYVSHFATCPNAAQHRTPARQPLLPMAREEGETVDGPPPMHDGSGDS